MAVRNPRTRPTLRFPIPCMPSDPPRSASLASIRPDSPPRKRCSPVSHTMTSEMRRPSSQTARSRFAPPSLRSASPSSSRPAKQDVAADSGQRSTEFVALKSCGAGSDHRNASGDCHTLGDGGAPRNGSPRCHGPDIFRWTIHDSASLQTATQIGLLRARERSIPHVSTRRVEVNPVE